MKKQPTEQDFVTESDHEDWENEYYARKSCGGLIGCASVIGMILMVLAALLIQLIQAVA